MQTWTYPKLLKPQYELKKQSPCKVSDQDVSNEHDSQHDSTKKQQLSQS